jgi:hypothetical protein
MERWHAHPDFSDSSQQRLQCKSNLNSEVPAQQLHGYRVESLDMFLECVAGKVGVPFHHINDDRPPRDDVALLGLLV